MELAVAKSKLIGDAHIFWLSHVNRFANERPERITTWDMLQKALSSQFLPVDAQDKVFEQLLQCQFHRFNKR